MNRWPPVRARGVPKGRCGSCLARARANLRETHLDQFLDERLRQGAIDGEVQGALGHRVAVELVSKPREDRAAERQVAQVILERGKAGDRLTAYAGKRERNKRSLLRREGRSQGSCGAASEACCGPAPRHLAGTRRPRRRTSPPLQLSGRGNARMKREAAVPKRLAEARDRSRPHAVQLLEIGLGELS